MAMEQQFVVEVREPVTGTELPEVAARVAQELGIPTARVEQLLSRRLGAITRPISQDNAEEIVEVLREAGVKAVARPLEEGNVRLSSTRWVPSPHEVEAYQQRTGPRFVLEEESAPVVPSPPHRVRERRMALVVALAVLVGVLLVLQATPILAGGARPISAHAGYELGLDAYREGRFAEARQVWQAVAAVGHAQAQFMLGYLSEKGLGESWSNVRAARWYRQAGEQGHTGAQVRLGDLYARGMGVPHDEAVAVEWFERAAREGDPEGQYRLAQALFHGRGVAQDLNLALTWFAAAAGNGKVEAEAYLVLGRQLRAEP